MSPTNTTNDAPTAAQKNGGDLVGTIWRDSLWHTFTVTSVRIDSTDPGREVILRGTFGNCTPGLCVISHDGMTDTKVATLTQARTGRIHGFSRQDVWEADPSRAPKPVVTGDERARGLAAWAHFDDIAEPVQTPSNDGRVIDAGLPREDSRR